MIPTPGELYIVGEKDLVSGADTPFVKIGIVREHDKRTTESRLKEHQTGNPRMLHIYDTVLTPAVERVETLLHGRFAPWRVSGEWFHLDAQMRQEVTAVARAIAATLGEKKGVLASAEDWRTKPSTDHVVDATDEAKQLYRRYREAVAVQKLCTAIAASVRGGLLGGFDAGHDVGRFISVVEKISSPSFDEKRFKEEHPALWEGFLVPAERWENRFLPAKVKDDDIDAGALHPALGDLHSEVKSLLAAPLDPGHTYAALHDCYLRMLSIEAAVELDKELLEAELKVLCGEASGIDGVCTWKRLTKVSDKFDADKFKAEYPKQHEAYMVQKPPVKAVSLAFDRGFSV